MNPRLHVTLQDRLNTLKCALYEILCAQDNVKDAYVKTDNASLLRLLNLEVWAVRYCVPLGWIVTTLQEWYARSGREPGTLGFRGVPAATGVRARERIEEAIAQLYPGGENLQPSRASAMEPVRAKSVSEYRDSVDRYKRQAEAAAKQYQRPWRGNPWR